MTTPGKLRGTSRFYFEDASDLDSIDALAEHLHSLLSSPTVVREFPGQPEPVLLTIKAEVERINGLKIEIYPNEHPPPHFHVVAAKVNASFSLEDCSFIEGNIGSKDRKKIEYWYSQSGARKALIDAWNRYRPDDCVVGVYRETGN